MFFVAAMSTFGITYGVKAFNAVPGEVSLSAFHSDRISVLTLIFDYS